MVNYKKAIDSDLFDVETDKAGGGVLLATYPRLYKASLVSDTHYQITSATFEERLYLHPIEETTIEGVVYTDVNLFIEKLNEIVYNEGSSLALTPEDVTNKSTDIEADKTSNTKYPTVKAVYDWATNLFVKATDLATTLSNYATKLYVDTALANKVDKITGYGLSKNDFTDADKSKLDNLPYWQTLYQDADRNLINTINVLQKAFSTTAFPNGAFSPPEIGVYEFEWEFAVQDLSAVSGILSVGFLGSATFTVKYHMTSQKTSFTSSSGPYNIFAETTGFVNTSTSTTSTQAHGFISGTIEVTSLGTIIPCFLFNQSATPLVKKGTIFKIAKSKTPISNFS